MHVRLLLPIGTLTLLACGGEPTPVVPEVYEAPVSCDWSSPGPPMLEGTVEAEQDFASVLATVDPSSVPDPIDLSGLEPFERGLVNWMAGRRSGTTLAHSDLHGPLGQAVLASFASGTLDLFTLREGLQYSYACDRPLPADLATLKARYGDYLSWPLVDVPCGLPKDERRLVWTHPDDALIVAETVTDDGDVRETEVLFRNLRDDGQLDFAVYNRTGLLMDRSTFATRGGTPTTFGAPFICISCHMGGANVDVQHPDGLGAGCVD